MTGLFGFNWGLPENIAELGSQIDSMMSVIHWFMLALFVGWGVFFAYCLFRFRARAGHRATYEPIHATWSKYLEIGIAIFEVALLIGFSMPVWASFKRELPPEDKATDIRIVAQQFQWQIWYPGFDGKYGKANPKFMSGANPAGLDPNDPAGKDDYVSPNELRFPIDKPVRATIMSKDVIHSFGVPALRIKQDAIPGMEIPIWWKAIKTGQHEIACSQLCGNSHYNMKAFLFADSPEAYKAWQDEWWTKPEGAEGDATPAPGESPAVATPTPASSPSPAPTPAGSTATPAPASQGTATPPAAVSPAAPTPTAASH